MMNAAFMDPGQVARIFTADTGHVAMNLTPLQRPRLLWLNRRAMRQDPQFAPGWTEAAYGDHLLRSCAFGVRDADDAQAAGPGDAHAVADRYGGKGIGRNGGSGRAVFIHGYHVKGVGRTPLISVLTDRAHASGGAYLEECVREAICSELVDAEFPGGSVPVLAIIETGEVQVWNTDAGPKPERRCLLVRPAFMRPAHFVRATEFVSGHPHEGSFDAHRVARTAQAACAEYGGDAFATLWRRFWLRWAEQLAYGYVHRVNHGGSTESNIALDGRLLDFGAMTALPSWARASTMQGGAPAGMDMFYLAQGLQAAAPFIARHIDGSMASPQAPGDVLMKANQRHREVLVTEVLRVVGLTRQHAAWLLAGPAGVQAVAACQRLVAHFLREQFCIFDGIPQPRIAWDLGEFWNEVTPPHTRELRRLIESTLGDAPFGGAVRLRDAIAARCALRTATRDRLFRDAAKQALHASLDGRHAGDALTPAEVARIIDLNVLDLRRDCPLEPEGCLPIGFARSADAGYALFVRQGDGRCIALQEWGSTPRAGVGSPDVLHVEAVADGSVHFVDPARGPAMARLHRGADVAEPVAG